MQKDWIDRMSDENKALKTTIARLTAERDEARASTAAAYERAAQVCDDVHIILGDGPKRVIGEYQEDVQPLIRSLATEPGTTALAEMLDAETRACAEVALRVGPVLADSPYLDGMQACAQQARAAILARLDQRKEAVE